MWLDSHKITFFACSPDASLTLRPLPKVQLLDHFCSSSVHLMDLICMWVFPHLNVLLLRCEPHSQTVRVVHLLFCLPGNLSLVKLCLPRASCVCEHGNSETSLSHPISISPHLTDLYSDPDFRAITESFLFTTPKIFLSTNKICSPSNQFCPIHRHTLKKFSKFTHTSSSILRGKKQINVWLLVYKYCVQEDTGAVVREYWEQKIMIQEFCTLLWYHSCVKARESHSQICKCSNIYDVFLLFLI